MEEYRGIPTESGEALVSGLYGRKVQIKEGNIKYTGRVVDIAYTEHATIKILLDTKINPVELDMKSYLKVLK